MDRCAWVNRNNPLYVRYHDEEWGVPLHDDGALYELLILESFQAGLSWECVLNKREAFRRAFDGFDPQAVASYGEEKIEALASVPCLPNSLASRRISQRCPALLPSPMRSAMPCVGLSTPPKEG